METISGSDTTKSVHSLASGAKLAAASACKVAAAGLPEVTLLVQPCSWYDENWGFAVPHADIAPLGFPCFSEKPASLGRWSHAK